MISERWPNLMRESFNRDERREKFIGERRNHALPFHERKRMLKTPITADKKKRGEERNLLPFISQ